MLDRAPTEAVPNLQLFLPHTNMNSEVTAAREQDNFFTLRIEAPEESYWSFNAFPAAQREFEERKK